MTFLARLAVCALLAILLPRSAAAADATLFRIFLTDGTSVVSYGEYARVEDQVIFSMPTGGTPDQPRLQIVTLRASAVDWSRTEQSAASARYERYVATRAEDDFRQLSNEVARVLNDIALTTDPQQALAIAEQARRTLTNWPRTHYGYRQDDVREIVSLIDDAIARLRGNANAGRFDLALVASPLPTAEAPPAMPMPKDAVTQLLKLSTLTTRVADRVALLQSALALLADPAGGFNGVDALALRRSVEGQLREEAAVDDRYARMSQRLIAAATRAAARAGVADVEGVLDRIPREDVRLGGRRPEVVQSLRAAVEAQLSAARRLRLLRDQWLLRRDIYRDYQKTIESQVLQLVKAQPALDAIRRLEGPAPDRLMELRGRLAGGAERLARMHVADDLRATHELLVSAWRFAEHAVDSRYAAITSGKLATAWEASSAAAGALMMLTRAQQEIRQLLDPPRLQ
jgi:hypothetical protein